MIDFNVDALKKFPNQQTDGDPTECVALTVTDIAGNADNRLYDNNFTYAATLQLEGVPPNTSGSDPLTGMQSAVCFGLLSEANASFNSEDKGELYVANFQNYSDLQKQQALQYAKNGLKNVVNKDAFSDIINAINANKTGISMPLHWFESFAYPVDGVLPTPNGSFANHNVAIYGQKTINNIPYLIAKPWLGPSYGDGGYCYISQEICNTVCLGAYQFNQNAIRWISIIGILLTRFPQLLPFVPKLLSINGDTNMQTANSQKVYAEAKACLGQRLAANNAVDGFGAFGCAESVNAVFQKAIGQPVGGGASTAAMFTALKDTSRFDSVLFNDALPGDIMISPTGYGASPATHGHVGIIGYHGICSNNSEDGMWEENYSSLTVWKKIFGDTLGFPCLVFRVK